MWTWDLAKELIDDLEPKLRKVGFGIGLTGSVLYRGSSTKDLDIIVFPLNVNGFFNQDDAREVLLSIAMRRVASKESVHIKWRMQGSNDTKHVEVWQLGKRRIDVFFLS